MALRSHACAGSPEEDRTILIRSLTDQLAHLNMSELVKIHEVIQEIRRGVHRDSNARNEESKPKKDWPHAPMHRLSGKGSFLVTAATHWKEHIFREPRYLSLLQDELLEKATRYQWNLEAWAIFSNHYHFVGQALDDANTLRPFIIHLHSESARRVNQLEGTPGRRVWYNFWDTELTFERSYQARLNYVHQNAVKHGIVPVANQYRWCSASWFERTATPAQVKTIYGFKTDKVNVIDDFETLAVR